MNKETDFREAGDFWQVYIRGLVAEAEAVVKENPHLLQAFSDFMDVNHEKVEPYLKKQWEHNAMWLLHKKFMDKVDEIRDYLTPPYRHAIDELTNIMKLIAEIVDLALLETDDRDIVESWAERYKEGFSGKGEP